jgi:uncharacterized membrane protein YidH (DUF202 family)
LTAPTLPGDLGEDGLQAERTSLAWSRTSIGILGNGVLLLLHDVHGHTGPLRFIPAGLAIVVALLTYLVGVHRQRVLRRRPCDRMLVARREVWLVGVSIVTLAVLTAVLLPVGDGFGPR